MHTSTSSADVTDAHGTAHSFEIHVTVLAPREVAWLAVSPSGRPPALQKDLALGISRTRPARSTQIGPHGPGSFAAAWADKLAARYGAQIFVSLNEVPEDLQLQILRCVCTAMDAVF